MRISSHCALLFASPQDLWDLSCRRDDELLFDPAQTIESLAIREGKSERSIRMTLSLAFMSPVLAQAAMEGRLPRGFCVKRLTDLPMLWSEQWRAVGLQQPIQAQAEPI